MGKQKCVLVIDDNKKNMELFRDLLLMRDYRVVEAFNGKTGVAVVEKENPDLIILDWQMPVMSGQETLKILKGKPKTSGIPVLVITAYAMYKEVENIKNSGCEGFLNKPIDISEFFRVTEKLLSGMKSDC